MYSLRNSTHARPWHGSQVFHRIARDSWELMRTHHQEGATVKTTTQRRSAAIALGGISLAVTLAGCASGAGASDTSSDSTESSDSSTSESTTIVTAVTVTSNATNPNSVRFQGEFVDGIAAEVVGVDIDELSVDKVAGSSLTSDGFNDAIEQIKAEAVA